MKILLLSIILILSSSCASLKEAFKKAAAHEKMAKQLEVMPYEMSAPDLQKKVVESITSTDITKGKWVYTANPQQGEQEKLMKVEERMNDGFIYKDKLYVSGWTPDMSLFSGDMEKFKGSVLKSSYHVIEQDTKNFTIVKGNFIYEGKEISPGKTMLRVYKLTQVVTPVSVGVDWWALLKGKGLMPSFKEEPVDFVRSRKYQVDDKTSNISMFFYIDPARAEKMEAELIAAEPG